MRRRGAPGGLKSTVPPGDTCWAPLPPPFPGNQRMLSAATSGLTSPGTLISSPVSPRPPLGTAPSPISCRRQRAKQAVTSQLSAVRWRRKWLPRKAHGTQKHLITIATPLTIAMRHNMELSFRLQLSPTGVLVGDVNSFSFFFVFFFVFLSSSLLLVLSSSCNVTGPR